MRQWITASEYIALADLPVVSIELEGGLVIFCELRVLVFLAQKTITDSQHFHISAHEAAESVLWRANDGLASNVEAGVNDHRASGALVESLDESVIAGIGFLMHGLDAGRIIDVGNCRNVATWHVELFDAKQPLAQPQSSAYAAVPARLPRAACKGCPDRVRTIRTRARARRKGQMDGRIRETSL